jgi:hypothetical protein
VEASEQQRRPESRLHISRLAQTLTKCQLEFDEIDLADLLWLAQFVAPVEPSAAASSETSESNAIEERDETPLLPTEPSLPLTQAASQPSTSKPTDQPAPPKGTPFATPTAPALRTRLDLARALRPLMRKVPSRVCFDLNEEETVTRIAETGVWLPVQRPSRERWLELDLVIEDSKTTAIWERTIAELKHLVEYQGAFRVVRTWRLTTLDLDDCRPVLLPGWCESNDPSADLAPRPRTPRELIDARGRRAIWVVSDCVSSLWQAPLDRADGIYDVLDQWGRSQPLAIMQMFPSRLWSRTALRRGYTVQFGALMPGAANARLEVRGLPRRLVSRPGLVNVPIMTLEAASLVSWSRTIAGAGEALVFGRTFDRLPVQSRRSRRRGDEADVAAIERVIEQVIEPTARERVQQFKASATPTVLKLATLMAATPVSLPVIDLLREAFAGEFPEPVQQYHVAEVLLSGLLQRCDREDERVCRYEFWGNEAAESRDRVRDILLGGASLTETERVLNLLSASICHKLGSPVKNFEALLGELPAEETDLRAAALPFAQVSLQVLQRLGGEYAEIADRFAPRLTEAKVIDPPIITRRQPPNTPSDRYVSYSTIEGVCQAKLTNNGVLLRIKAPHQMGKTKLAVRLCQFAETQDYDCVVIDFRAVTAGQLATLDHFWRWFCQTIADDLDIDTPLDKHWNAELLGSNSSCEKYLQNAVLKQTSQALVLIFENVDRLFEELAIAEEVFRVVRAWHEKAKTSKPWRKLRQVWTYSTEPLTKLDFAYRNHSPFNVGEVIELTSLSPVQVEQLAGQFGLRLNEAALAQLMADFGGHPALIQQAFDRLAANPTLELAELYAEALHPANGHLRNLTHELGACGLAEAMARVAGSIEPIAIEQDTAYALYRLGLVDWDADRRRVKPRCRLYRDRFA